MSEVTARQIEEPATASMILEESIRDIQRGQWLCGELTQHVPYQLDAKPMGCAVGLVGINGGAARLHTSREHTMLWAEMSSPEEGWHRWPLKARQAVLLLAQALPKGWRPPGVNNYDVNDNDQGEQAATSVINYNDTGDDGDNITPGVALAWFKRAHELSLDKRL